MQLELAKALARFSLLIPLFLVACLAPEPALQGAANPPQAAAVAASGAPQQLVIQDFEIGLDGVKSGPLIHPAIESDPQSGGHYVSASYEATSEVGPLRDVWSTPRSRDWGGARGIGFRIRTDNPIELSVSFIDKNGLGFTQRSGPLKVSTWQTVLLPVDKFWFNRFAQPDKTPAPPDLSDVPAFGFAPVSTENGRFEIDDFVVLR